MRLEFSGFIAEGAFDALAKLELRTAKGALQIGEPFCSKVLEFWDERLELFDALGEVFDCKGLRPGPFGFCACHGVWEKCSPRLVD